MNICKALKNKFYGSQDEYFDSNNDLSYKFIYTNVKNSHTIKGIKNDTYKHYTFIFPNNCCTIANVRFNLNYKYMKFIVNGTQCEEIYKHHETNFYCASGNRYFPARLVDFYKDKIVINIKLEDEDVNEDDIILHYDEVEEINIKKKVNEPYELIYHLMQDEDSYCISNKFKPNRYEIRLPFNHPTLSLYVKLNEVNIRRVYLQINGDSSFKLNNNNEAIKDNDNTEPTFPFTFNNDKWELNFEETINMSRIDDSRIIVEFEEEHKETDKLHYVVWSKCLYVSFIFMYHYSLGFTG